jgi:hypothetical protein
MVGSAYILINKNGRRTLLNTAQITAVSDQDILLTDAVRRIIWEFPPEQEVCYMVRVHQPDGPLNFMFVKQEERDELLNEIIAAISPSVTINSAPGLPRPWAELDLMVPAGKYIFNGQQYATRAEYEQAREAHYHQRALDAIEAKQRSQDASQDVVSLPTPKPPRKPYTRKPRE